MLGYWQCTSQNGPSAPQDVLKEAYWHLGQGLVINEVAYASLMISIVLQLCLPIY